MDRFKPLISLGQSLWYDNIQRQLLRNGEMAGMIARGEIRGVTSNPTIFNNAIAKSQDYDEALKPMAWAGWTPEQIFYQLAVEDIQDAADLFQDLYRQSQGGDGYVSLEVSPYLANDSQGTLEEAKRLWARVNRPNLMIKIPATPAGIPAIRQAIAAGINVNVTLIFSLERYAAVMDAYLSGLEERTAAGLAVDGIASVASFFVSRVDSKIDPLLESKYKAGEHAAGALRGKAAIANAKLAYALFRETFGGERFQRLQAKGARLQRPLWASTSTKNPAYRDVIYIEELIGADTVNTVPPQTLVAFGDHGEARPSLTQGVDAAREQLAALEQLGIHMDEVTRQLEEEGVRSFADAFTALLKSIEERRSAMQAELGSLQGVAERVAALGEQKLVERIHAHEVSVWSQDAKQQEEIRRRLGWLDAPQRSMALIPDLNQVASECQAAGYTQVLLLGMGGSSLAPEVLRLTFGVGQINGQPALDLTILDSTDPGQVRAAGRRSAVERTLYIVASKSGSTAEVSAFIDFFWGRARQQVGERAGEHFIAITDPGTSLEQLAQERGFRRILHADPSVGGRFSALIVFGMLPAALLGMDVSRLLGRAQDMAWQCRADLPAGRNPGLVLGAILSQAEQQGRNKLCFMADPGFASFGSWLEQLVAESSGKDGKGIIPVDGGKPLAGGDRLYVYLRQNGRYDRIASRLRAAGVPVLVLPATDAYDLGAEFYRWAFATAVVCALLGVNAFNQPDVQDNKERTRSKIAEYARLGRLPEEQPVWQGKGGRVYGMALPGLETATSLAEVVARFLELNREGDYIAINAYLPRNKRIEARLQRLRLAIQECTGRVVTLGFGPRFLHSTGQLHKGGADNGLFLQITADPNEDVTIPGQGMTFGTLERAQALGDLEALLARQRRAIRVHLVDASLEELL